MLLRYLPTILFASLLIFDKSHAMERQNANLVKVQCYIHNNTERLSFITFSGDFAKNLHATRNVDNTLALQSSVTGLPTVTINPITSLITIQCAFKDITMQQSITVNEDVPICSQRITRPLPHDWHMLVITTLSPSDDAER